MQLFDSHAHLSDDRFLDDFDLVIARAFEAGVGGIVNICTDLVTLDRGLELALRYPEKIFNAAATPPHTVEAEGEQAWSRMEAAARSGQLVAIGETGLDYHYDHSPRGVQRNFLERYLELASTLNLPVVIHCRDAFADFFEILDTFPSVRGVLHCFTGTVEEAFGVIERGWCLSLSGIATFKKSGELREVATQIPLNQVLIETDSPYLAPQSRRGKRNEPAFVQEVAELIASVRGLSVEEVATQTLHNARALFRLP
jgi:TatD DNase family protein